MSDKNSSKAPFKFLSTDFEVKEVPTVKTPHIYSFPEFSSHEDTTKLYQIRLNTLEEIIAIQNEEINKQSDADYRERLNLWRQKVFMLLVENKALRLKVQHQNTTAKSYQKNIQKLSSQVNYLKKLDEQEKSSFDIKMKIQEKKNKFLEMKMSNEIVQKKSLVEKIDKVSELYKKIQKVTDKLNQADDIVCMKLDQYSSRIEFIRNRIVMLEKLILTQKNKFMNEKKEFQEKIVNLEEKSKSKVLLNTFKNEINVLKKERDYLLKNNSTKMVDKSVQCEDYSLKKAEMMIKRNIVLLENYKKNIELENSRKFFEAKSLFETIKAKYRKDINSKNKEISKLKNNLSVYVNSRNYTNFQVDDDNDDVLKKLHNLKNITDQIIEENVIDDDDIA